MNDPLSPLTVPPPRYLLESDSSDEEGQGAYPSSSTSGASKSQSSSSQITITLPETTEELDEIVLGLGQAGRYISRSLGNGDSVVVVGDVRVEGKVIGRGLKGGEGVLLLGLEEGDLGYEGVWELAERLVDKVKAKKWTIITSYVPSMYIPSRSERTSRIKDEAPIRYLASSSNDQVKEDGANKFDAPNYLTGLAAALTALSAHPSSPSMNITTLTLPLPLSSLSTNRLVASLQPISPLFAGLVGTKSRTRWTEDDDEPFAAPGMGKVRGVRRGVGEAASMYT